MRHTTIYGTYAVDQMPQQPQLALCHGFFVPTRQRGRGFAHRLKDQQMGLLRADNFDFAICTCDSSNAAQQAVLTKAGWSKLAEFNNTRTGGKTEIWGSTVGDGGPARVVEL